MDDLGIEKAGEQKLDGETNLQNESKEESSHNSIEKKEEPIQPKNDSVIIGKVEPTSVPSFDANIDESQKPNSFSDPALKEQSNRTLFMTLAVILGVFVLFIAGFYGYNSITGNVVFDMQGLHEANIDGNLEEEQGYMYNGFSFVFVDGLWWTDIIKHIGDSEEKVRIPLHFGPKDFEEVEFKGSTSEEFNMGPDVYIAIDPAIRDQHYTLAISELVFNLAKGINRRPVAACIKEDVECVERPIVSCDNNPENLPVIELVHDYDVNSMVELDGTCIKITGNSYGLVKAVDNILLEWYGVIS